MQNYLSISPCFSNYTMPSLFGVNPYAQMWNNNISGSIFSMPFMPMTFPTMPTMPFFPIMPNFSFFNPVKSSAAPQTTASEDNSKTEERTAVPAAGSLNAQMVSKAKSYVGVVNSTAQGNQLFSPKGYQNTGWYKKYGRWGWCCDFAVYCAKDTLGSKYPKDMVTSSPDGLAKAAQKHNAYLSVPSSNKNSWLANNIKPGDIIHMKGKGDSGKHIAVVESVDSNGNIKAVSGNSGGKVKSVNYNINTSGIYGFVSLQKIAA